MAIPGLFVVTVAIVVGAAALPKGGVDLLKGECVATTTLTTKVEFVGFMVGGRGILVGLFSL